MENTEMLRLNECENYRADRIEPAVVHMHKDEGSGRATLWVGGMPRGIDLTEEAARALACAVEHSGTECTLRTGTTRNDGRDPCGISVTYSYDGTCYIGVEVDGEECTLRMSAYERAEFAQGLVKSFCSHVPEDLLRQHEGDDLPDTGASE